MGDEKKLKSILKSLTLSSPKGLTVSDLIRDYHEMVGSSIPFKAMGYSDIFSYLKSIPDTLRVSGAGMSALVIPVTDEKTMHLEEMIRRQKKPALPKRRNQNRSRYESYRSRPQVIQRPNAIKKTSAVKEDATDDECYSFSRNKILQCEAVQEKLNNLRLNDSFSSDESEMNKMRTFSRNSNHSTPIYTSCQNKQKIRSSNASANEYMSASISRAYKDPFKNKLRQLISNYPQGIWCSDLPQIYEKHFNESLNVSEKGYCSVIHFCSSHADIFVCVKPNRCDWKVYDVRCPITEFVADSDYTTDDDSNAKAPFKVRKESALPELDFEDFVHQEIPSMVNDILPYGEEINKQCVQIPDDGFIMIRVTEIYDPTKFWFEIYSTECSAVLDKLMDDMQNFYACNDTYNIPTSDVREKLYCVAMIYNEWHRAQVIKIENDETVSVFFFDYGTVGKIGRASLKYLHLQFCDLPRQAIRARLANIRPLHSLLWKRGASELFLKLASNKILYAEIMNRKSLSSENRVLQLILTDTSDPEIDVHINDQLVAERWAQVMTNNNEVSPCKKTRTIKKSDYFLYPLHQHIEDGIAPTVDEVTIMTSNGVSLEMIFKPYIKALENGEYYGFDFTPSPKNNVVFHSSKHNETEDGSCTGTADILPPTGSYESDERSSIGSIDTVYSTPPSPGKQRLKNNANHETAVKSVNTERKFIDEAASSSIKESNNIEPLSNSRVVPPPGFLPKIASSAPVINNFHMNSFAQNPYYNPYPCFQVPSTPNPAHLMQSMMYHEAAAAVAAQSYLLMSPIISTPFQNPHLPYTYQNILPLNNPLPVVQNLTSLLPHLNNILPANIPQRNFPLNNISLNIVHRRVVTELLEDLNILLTIKEDDITEEIRLLICQLQEIIKRILSDNGVSSIEENLIAIIRSRVAKVLITKRLVQDKCIDKYIKLCAPDIQRELNLNKDQTLSQENLFISNSSKSTCKTSLEFREFANKSLHVVNLNDEYYFITLEFILAYTKFTDLNGVKTIFSTIDIEFPSIEFDMEQYTEVYEQLLGKNVPGCLPDTKIIQLIKFKDVPIMLETLFATNPVLVSDLRNFTNQTRAVNV